MKKMESKANSSLRRWNEKYNGSQIKKNLTEWEKAKNLLKALSNLFD